jgi:hypothetical protein
MVIKLKDPLSPDKEVDTGFSDEESYDTPSEAESDLSLADGPDAGSSARDWVALTDAHCRHSHTHRNKHVVCILKALDCKRHASLRHSETTALPGMFRLAFFANGKAVPNCARADSRKTPGEYSVMTADWKLDHTAAMTHMTSDTARAARIADIEAEAGRIFHSTPSAGLGLPPLMTPQAFKRSPKSNPPSSLLAATKYTAASLFFPAPLEPEDFARGGATTTDDASTDDEADPSDTDAHYSDETASDDEDNEFAEREAFMAGQIKAAMDALALQKEVQAEASAKKKRAHAKAKADSQKRRSRAARTARTMESERQLQILLAEIELARAAFDEDDDSPATSSSDDTYTQPAPPVPSPRRASRTKSKSKKRSKSSTKSQTTHAEREAQALTEALIAAKADAIKNTKAKAKSKAKATAAAAAAAAAAATATIAASTAATATATTSAATTSTGPLTMKFWAIVVGRCPGVHHGILSSITPFVAGYPGALYSGFDTEIEAQHFCSTSGSSMQTAPTEYIPSDPAGLVKPDASAGDPNALFGITVQSDPQTMKAFAPVGFPQVHTIQMAQSTVDPFKEIGSGACFFVDKATDISSLTKAMEDMQRGVTKQDDLGIQNDASWRKSANNPLALIKTEKQLKAALHHAHSLRTRTLESANRNFEAVFTAAGWPASYIKMWAASSLFARLGTDTFDLVIQLLLHLNLVLTEHGFPTAKTVVEFYGEKIGLIRSSAAGRLTALCQIYAFLRDAQHNQWNSLSLTTAKEQALRDEMALLRTSFPSPGAATAPPSPHGCSHCKSTTLHTGGKPNCFLKSLSSNEAKKRAIEITSFLP